jgi:hypothetical protein
VLEAIGLAYLIWLWFAAGLDQRERREGLLNSGRIPGPVAQDV